MSDPRIDFIRRLSKRPSPALNRAIEKSRAEDIAVAMSHIAPGNQRAIWAAIGNRDEKAAEVLACIESYELPEVVQMIDFDQLIRLLKLMEVDDEANVISYLPEELQNRILEKLHSQERDQVEHLLAYPEESAGGLMHPDVIRMKEYNSCRDAIAMFQEAEDVEMAFYLYVENDSEQLVGVVSLRALLTHPPSTPLKNFMITEVITVLPEDDQEDVAKLVSRYDLLAIPVVDHNRKLLGIITVDDVLDVIQDIANKNMLLMAGVNEEHNPRDRNIFRAFQQRFTWLLITLLGGIGMAELIGVFESALEKEAALAGFIPVMLGTGGNVGTQAATIAVRNIAIGSFSSRDTLYMFFKEAQVGLLLGISFATVLGGYAFFKWHETPYLAIAIAISIITTVVCAALLGMLVPITLDRLGIDPAVATGPFVTTGIDLVAILIYFTTCGAILD